MNFRLTLLLLLLQKKSVGFPFLYLLAAVHLSVSWHKYNTDKCANKIAKKKNQPSSTMKNAQRIMTYSSSNNLSRNLTKTVYC